MSHTARRLRRSYVAPANIEIPQVPTVTDEEHRAMPLRDRVLLQEHQRHADRLAEIRRVADKLAALDSIVQAAQADGAHIEIGSVSQAIGRFGNARINAVRLSDGDGFFSSRAPRVKNAVANALLSAGWRVIYASAHDSGGSWLRDTVVFMKGHRAVETHCLRQWLLDAIEAGHITETTEGKHPAKNEPVPLNSTAAA
ncbi:hypothetical protein EC845_1934 [Comamonas sp. BIGb0124]|uniref:hypothetical protein n=1 Tax=Comamonas sp. BIGb0124 TaxID=2485130 RepID=UPI000F4AC457|nr:hypothetical protein [Comamonas sp. BIGb0124]ROR23021.1 hypothetical protein EC845_1934 [Comamonas sp. BIGb0124]